MCDKGHFTENPEHVPKHDDIINKITPVSLDVLSMSLSTEKTLGRYR